MSADGLANASHKRLTRQPRPAKPQRWGDVVWSILRMSLLTLASPILLAMAVRRSMTAASVTLLLFGIVSLNIVWGYPWLGPFSAITALLATGWLCNYVLRPRLAYDFSLPNHSPAGEPFEVVIEMQNPARLPALEMSVGFDAAMPRSRWRPRPKPSFDILSERTTFSLLRPGQRHASAALIQGRDRGWHRLPDVTATSLFPFHLFRSTQRFRPTTEIAITPRPLTGDEDPLARGLMDTLGGWAFRLHGGDALDYTGSREYEVGMPVRRWDFVSWARLGRPIVQEFSAPSVQMVTILVDTSPDVDAPDKSRSRDARLQSSRPNESLERLLSLAATAVNELCRRRIRTRLFVTSEETETFATNRNLGAVTESEPMLIQLTSAQETVAVKSDHGLVDVLEQSGRSPVLLLSRRSTPPSSVQPYANVTFLSVSAAPAPDDDTSDVPQRFDAGHSNFNHPHHVLSGDTDSRDGRTTQRRHPRPEATP